MLIVREANYLTEMKSDGDGHKETYLDDWYFYVSLKIYLFVNKGKIFDSQVSWRERAEALGPIQVRPGNGFRSPVSLA
jgi:hypothetical protein